MVMVRQDDANLGDTKETRRTGQKKNYLIFIHHDRDHRDNLEEVSKNASVCVLCQSISTKSRLTIMTYPRSNSRPIQIRQICLCTLYLMIHRINQHVEYPDPAISISIRPIEPTVSHIPIKTNQRPCQSPALLFDQSIREAETRTPFVKVPYLLNLSNTVISFVISRVSFAVLDLDTVWMN